MQNPELCIKKSHLDKFLIVSSKGTVERNAKSSWLFNNILETFLQNFFIGQNLYSSFSDWFFNKKEGQFVKHLICNVLAVE